MRSFFPLLAVSLLVFSGTAFGQISVIGGFDARACFLEAVNDGSDSSPCDRAIESKQVLGRDLAATYVNRAVVRTNAGRYEAALADLDRAEALRPNLGEIYASRGNIYFFQNNFEDALAQYDRGIEAGMKMLHAAHYDRGLALEQLGRIEEAKEAYRQSIAIAPEFDAAKVRLSMH